MNSRETRLRARREGERARRARARIKNATGRDASSACARVPQSLVYEHSAHEQNHRTSPARVRWQPL
eukprot:1323778-Pleurochrysis_carterae.AAC.2